MRNSYQQLSLSINHRAPDESSGLLQLNLSANAARSSSKKAQHYYRLYDSISFAAADDESPLFASSQKTTLGSDTEKKPKGSSSGGGGGFFRGKFRIFLASYVLVGITLAIYSRNALSLAAVGMVANNVIDKELVNIIHLLSASQLDHDGSTRNQSSLSVSLRSNDGSCPILDEHPEKSAEGGQQQQQQQQQTPRHELERAFRSSIRQRIESGQLMDWTPSEQGLVFAAGSLGNLLISIPITRMGEIYGPKWCIFAALAGATVQAALMPLVAPLHISLVIVFQVIFSGLAFGADCVAYTLFAHWLTPTEIAFFVACLVVCYQLGAILSSVITAQILTGSENLDWAWCFYVPAILCALWTFVWIFVGASEPATSAIISAEELDYLALRSKLSQAGKTFASSSSSSSSSSETLHDENEDNPDRSDPEKQQQQQLLLQQHQQRPVSWLKLAKDPNIWAIIAVKFTLRWYFSVNISLMPTYLSSVTHMSVDTIGKVSAVQSIIGLVSGLFMSYITKSVVSKRPFNLSLAAFRKLFQSVVNFGLAGSLILFTLFDCDRWLTIVTLTVACVCINFHVAAALQIPLDLSPNYCGLITSITNTLALGQAIGAPISGLILNSGPKDRNLWRIVWGISILLNVLSGSLFILLVDSKPRDYSKSSSSTTTSKNPPKSS